MQNKEIENIISNLKDSFLYSEGIPGRMTKSCYYIAEHTKEDLNKLFEYIDQLENKIKAVEQVRDKLECEDYYCTDEALEDLDKIL